MEEPMHFRLCRKEYPMKTRLFFPLLCLLLALCVVCLCSGCGHKTEPRDRQAIIEEREKNGLYKSIFDFAQRNNYAMVNRKAFESLVWSGGFDSFGYKREQYFAYDSKGNMFLDALVRYGQLYQSEKMQSTHSLFGDMGEVEIATPVVPEAEELSDIERLNKEREYVGIYISAHPLDKFSVVLNGICNTSCSDLEDRAKLAEKEEVVVGGIVTAVKERFGKSGRKFGIVTLEDYNNSGELAVFGEQWALWKSMLSEDNTICIKAKCEPARFKEGTYNLNIMDVQYLQTVKETQIKKITISVKSDSIDDTVVSDLTTMLKASPGNTELFFQILDSETQRPVTLRSRAGGIDIKRDLLSYIDANPGMDYKIN